MLGERWMLCVFLKALVCYSFRGLHVKLEVINSASILRDVVTTVNRPLRWDSLPGAVRSKAKANFCICIQPPTLSCGRLNFKKREFSYFFWSMSTATNTHMRGARTRLHKEGTFKSHRRRFFSLKPALAFINIESINLKYEFHFMHPLWLLWLKA